MDCVVLVERFVGWVVVIDDDVCWIDGVEFDWSWELICDWVVFWCWDEFDEWEVEEVVVFVLERVVEDL